MDVEVSRALRKVDSAEARLKAMLEGKDESKEKERSPYV